MKSLFFSMILLIVFSSCSKNGDDINPGGGTGSGTTYQVGDTGPSGGKILYDRGANSGWRYIEASPVILGEVNWGCGGTTIGSVDGGMGGGLNNTAMILSACPTAQAAKLCNDYVVNGKDDWYLPSTSELNLIYNQNIFSGIINSPTYTGSKNFWTSVETTPTTSKFIRMDNVGGSGSNTKGSLGGVIAVRRF